MNSKNKDDKPNSANSTTIRQPDPILTTKWYVYLLLADIASRSEIENCFVLAHRNLKLTEISTGVRYFEFPHRDMRYRYSSADRYFAEENSAGEYLSPAVDDVVPYI